MPDIVPAVLVVDLDPETHMILEGALPESDCVIVSSRSAEMALKMAERRPPSVLVVDAKLAGLGYLTDRLRRLSPHIHQVLLVGADHIVEIAAPRATGGSVIRKPLDAARVRTALRSALRLAAMTAGVKRMHAGDGTADGDPSRPALLPREVVPPARRESERPPRIREFGSFPSIPEPRPTPRSNAPPDRKTPPPDRKTPPPDRGSAPERRGSPRR